MGIGAAVCADPCADLVEGVAADAQWRMGRGIRHRARHHSLANRSGAEAIALLVKRKGVRARLVRTAMITVQNSPSSDAEAREETERVARLLLSDLRSGLRPLELIATIAPLLGLLGTVLGMISAFQALQEAGSRADPSMLAGGIWEALLTTAAGMAVAIPASVALTWFEAVAERLRLQLEDGATRVFLTAP